MLAALLGPGALPAPALGIDVTSCGQQVPSGERGDLRANLSCDVGVHLGPGAALNLNGFTLTGNGALSSQGVQCLNRRGARCTINGPGEIRGFGAGVSCAGVRLEVRDVVLRFNRNGISCKAPRRIELSRVGATDNEVGIDVQGGGGPLRGHDVEVSHNSTAGINARVVTDLVRLIAVGNGEGGGLYVLMAGRSRRRLVRLTDSTVVDNDGLGGGFDVLTNGRATLVDTVCGRGARLRVKLRPPYTTTLAGRLGCSDD